MDQIKKANRELKNMLKKAFDRIEIKQCNMCGAYISGDEYDRGEGVCFKHWDV